MLRLPSGFLHERCHAVAFARGAAGDENCLPRGDAAAGPGGSKCRQSWRSPPYSEILDFFGFMFKYVLF